MLSGVKMAGKSHRGKNRGRASKDNSKVVADANGVHQSNLGDKPSGVDESTSAKSEVVDTMQTTSSNQPKQAEGNLTISRCYDCLYSVWLFGSWVVV